MAIVAQDITSSPFSVGDSVQVRGTVLSVTGTGAGAAVVVQVDQPGNVGDRAATLTVGPSQCRRSAGKPGSPTV